MAGIEDITPDQLTFILWLVFAIICVYSFCQVISSLLNWSASKNIRFKIKKEVAKQIAKEVQRKPLIAFIRKWLESRKIKKADPFNEGTVKYLLEPTKEKQ